MFSLGLVMAALETSFIWAPRWVDAYYSSTSLLRILYSAGLATHALQSQRMLDVNLSIDFWGETWQPRSAFVARYTYPTANIPLVSLNNGPAELTNTNVRQSLSFGDLLFEYEQPCYYFDGKLLYLRNLNLVSYSLTAASGQLNLSSAFAIHPIVEDSPIVLKDSASNTFIIAQEDGRFNNNRVQIENGSFTVSYLSKTVYNQIASGSCYITIGGVRYETTAVDLDNIWDQYAELFGSIRRDGETNVALKAKCQVLSLSQKPETKVGSLLGLAQIVVWNTETPLSLVGSGVTYAEPIEFPKDVFIEEITAPVSGVCTLSFVPSGLVQLFFNDQLIPATEYSTAGSEVTLSNKYANATAGSIRVLYHTSPYVVVSSGNNITSLTRTNSGKELVVVVAGGGVKFTTATKRLNRWRWDQESDTLGSANFT